MEGDKNFGNILFLFFGVSDFERKFLEFSFKFRMENLEGRNAVCDFG
jgi:hypothetical protein